MEAYPCEWARETPRIRNLVEKTRLKLQLPKPIQISWSNTTGAVGRAVFPAVMKPYLEFSIVLWPYASPDERDDTVIHEVCHVAAWEFTPPEERRAMMRKKKGHGETWERLMWLCGRDPALSRYATFPVPTHVLGRLHAYCLCGAHQITEAKYASILTRTKVYTCPKCKTALVIKK